MGIGIAEGDGVASDKTDEEVARNGDRDCNGKGGEELQEFRGGGEEVRGGLHPHQQLQQIRRSRTSVVVVVVVIVGGSGGGVEVGCGAFFACRCR